MFYRRDDLNAAARFLRNEVFQKIWGFNERLVAAEDYDLYIIYLSLILLSLMKIQEMRASVLTGCYWREVRSFLPMG